MNIDDVGATFDLPLKCCHVSYYVCCMSTCISQPIPQISVQIFWQNKQHRVTIQ